MWQEHCSDDATELNRLCWCLQFCRALDREDEYDANDHIAEGRGDDGPRPSGATEVRPGRGKPQRFSVSFLLGRGRAAHISPDHTGPVF